MNKMKHIQCSLARAALATVMLGIALPSQALADAKKYDRKTVEIKVKQTDATKKLEAKKTEEKAPAPEITADQFIQIQGEVQDIRDEQIREFKELIRETDEDDPEKADLLFRLAELFAQKQRYFHFRTMELGAKIDKAKNKSEKSKHEQERRKSSDQEKKWLVEAVKIYKAIAENPRFKDYKRMDESLFYYAYTLTEAKYDEEARKIYHRLIKDYPNSKYIPNAYLSFAEFYFRGNELEKAEKFYDKVLEFPKSSVYVYSLYMKGWVYFNQNRQKDSLETWLKVAQLTQSDKKQAQLNRAAKKDIVRAYSEVGEADKAHKFFQRVDADYAFKMLGYLGEYYLAQGKNEKTVYTFREMIDIDSQDGKFEKEVCEWEYTVVRAVLTMGTPELKIKEIDRLLKLNKALTETKAIPETNLAECSDNARSTTGELAMIWHQEGLKTLNLDTLAHAQKLYKLYLEYFPEAENAPELQFYHADLLWELARGEKNPSIAAVKWEETAVAHTKVVQLAKSNPERIRESAYAAVLAWQNAYSADPAKDRTDLGEERQAKGRGKDSKDQKNVAAPTPQPIPDKEQKIIDAFNVYIQYVKDPKDEKLVEIKFYKARINWKYKHFDEAIPLFEEVLRARPDHEIGEFAANLLLDSLNQSGKFDQLVTWVDNMLGMAKLLEDKDELKRTLEILKRQSMRKLAEQLEKGEKYKECGQAYVDIAERYPDGQDVHEVLFNAAVCFEKARLLGNAIKMRQKLTEQFPSKPEAQRAQYALGLNYAQIAFYEKAAEMYEKYAKKFSGEKDAPTALSNATFIRKGLGQDKEAIEDTNYFVKQFSSKQPQEAASAFYSIADIYEKKREYENVVKHLTEYLKRFGAKGGIDRQIIANARIGQILWRQSCPVKGVNDACIEVKRERALKQTGKKKKRDSGITQCGPASKNKIIVHERKPALVKQSQAYFNQAIKLWKGGDAMKDVGGKDDAEKQVRTYWMIQWVAAGNFYLAEEKNEKFLAIKFPENLDFDENKPAKKKDSLKRFSKWLEDKKKALALGETIYMKIVNEIKGGGAHYAIAAAARVGQLYQNLADALFTAEIPKDLQKADYLVEAYCDALVDQATPLEERSVTAFSFCLDTSTSLNWFNEWSQLCEGELAQIRPQDFPTAGEIRSSPDGVPLTLDTETILSELDLGAASRK